MRQPEAFLPLLITILFMARVYIETTIPSYYFETRRSTSVIAWREATREWWDRISHRYDLVTSPVTIEELARTPEPKRSHALELIRPIPVLPRIRGAEDAAQYYIDQRLIPADAFADGMHIALASLHNIEFLLTWNCKHLANANKTVHLTVLNTRLGLPVPTIVTPLTLVPEPNDAS